MPKGWVALPRSVQWLAGGIAAVVLGLALTWLLFVPVADWLAHHDVGSAGTALHETALDNARARLLTLGAGLFAAGALVFTARNFTLSRRAFELSRHTFELAEQGQRRTLELTEQGQVTDRYTRAIEHLGSDKLDVRIGGIYALERIAHDSARDHQTVMEVLTAFIREHSRDRWSSDPEGRSQERSTRPDIQAALTVVGRRDRTRHAPIHLTHADLTGANLSGAILELADLTGVNLTRADLTGTNLFHADLRQANLTEAILSNRDRVDPSITFDPLTADLHNADLNGAILTRAYLRYTNLNGANLTGANLSDADLASATLHYADFTDADLTGATLILADLSGAKWPVRTPVPDGWKLDTGSGRLQRADTVSGLTEQN
jgi:hypothetical protein